LDSVQLRAEEGDPVNVKAPGSWVQTLAYTLLQC